VTAIVGTPTPSSRADPTTALRRPEPER
jgi:hypothetical protein